MMQWNEKAFDYVDVSLDQIFVDRNLCVNEYYANFDWIC